TITLNADDSNASGLDGDVTVNGAITTSTEIAGLRVNIDADRDVAINQPITTLGGHVDIDAARDVNSAAAGDITTTGDAAGENSGNVTVDAGRNITLSGQVHTTGFNNAASAADSDGGLIRLTTANGNITTNAGATLNAVGGTTNDPTIMGEGGVITLDANDSAAPVDTADVSIGDTVMTSTETGGTLKVDIDADRDVDINAAITTLGGSVDIDAGRNIDSNASGTITTTGDKPDEDSGNVTIDTITAALAGNINLAAAVNTSGFDNPAGSADSDGGNVTINTANGTVTIAAINSSGGDVGLLATDVAGDAGLITLNPTFAMAPRLFLNGDLTAAGGNNVNAAPGAMTRGDGTNIVISDPTRLGADITITTTGNTSGAVIFGSTLAGSTDRGENLVIAAGTTDASATTTFGNVAFAGAVGTGALRLGNITIDSANNVLFNSTLNAASLTQLSGTGNTTFNADVNVNSGAVTPVHTFNGGTAVNTGTEQITIAAHGYTTGDNVVYNDGAGGANPGTGLIPSVTTIPGLQTGQTYVVIVDDPNTIRLALNQEHAAAGTAINLTPAGVGAHHSVAKAAVSVNTSGLIDVNGNILAEDGPSDANMAATGEQISLSASMIDLALDVSTASVAPTASTTYTATGDRISISATTSVTFAAGTEIITDAGRANTFEPHLPFAAIGAINPVQKFFIGADTLFLHRYIVALGAAGEINLQVHIDWRDPSNDGTPVTAPGIFNTVTSNRYQTFTVDTGGMLRTIGHAYSNLNDFIPFSLDNQPIFFADFSLSHHDSIQVQSPNLINNVSADNVQSSSDNPDTGSFNPLAAAHIAPNDGNFTGVGSLDAATDNTDLNFEDGLFEVKVQTIFPPFYEPEPPPPEPPAAPIAEVPPPKPEPLFVQAVEPVEFPLTSYSSQSEDYFQIRRQGSSEPVEGFEHIDDDVGWKLLQPNLFKSWVKQQPNLNGPGYELWLITTKVKGGQDVTFERPVLKFDVVDQQPFPMEEDMPDELPELKLERLDVDEIDAMMKEALGEQPEPEAQDQDDKPNADDASGKASDDDPINAKMPPIPESSPVISRVDDGTSTTVRSAMAGLTLSSLLARKRRGVHSPSPHTSTINRLLNRSRSTEQQAD
ncbi:MAG: hypothetical protein RIK87_23600, partial [Fuerstiella sp.]